RSPVACPRTRESQLHSARGQPCVPALPEPRLPSVMIMWQDDHSDSAEALVLCRYQQAGATDIRPKSGLRLGHMEDRRMSGDDLAIESKLIDLSEVDLAQLPTAQDSALARALRRILRAAENPDEAVSAFQQSI